MTSLWLYDSPDFVMEAVQKYPHSRLATCSPDRLLHSLNLHRWHLCEDRLSPEGRDGRIIYQPVVLDNFSRLRASSRSQMNRLVRDDRFSMICDSLYQPPKFLLHDNNDRFFSCLDVTHAHCIGHTNAISAFDLVALFKISLRCNQWSKSNKKLA